MDLNLLLQAAGYTGVFPARAFLPAFIAALCMRFGHEWPWLESTAFIQSLPPIPNWFTGDTTLIILGVLATLEVIGHKIPEVRETLLEVDVWIKPVMAGLTYAGVVSLTEAGQAGQLLEHEALERKDLWATVSSVVVGAFVWLFAQARAAALRPMVDGDRGDATGLQGILSWFEDLLAISFPVLLILFPLVMMAITAFIGLILLVMRWIALRREERSKLPCQSCGVPIYRSALACHSCGAPHQLPRRVGMFGQSKDSLVEDRGAHEYRLTEKRRCPVCATRLTKNRPYQDCEGMRAPSVCESGFRPQAICGAWMRALPLTLPRVLWPQPDPGASV